MFTIGICRFDFMIRMLHSILHCKQKKKNLFIRMLSTTFKGKPPRKSFLVLCVYFNCFPLIDSVGGVDRGGAGVRGERGREAGGEGEGGGERGEGSGEKGGGKRGERGREEGRQRGREARREGEGSRERGGGEREERGREAGIGYPLSTPTVFIALLESVAVKICSFIRLKDRRVWMSIW